MRWLCCEIAESSKWSVYQRCVKIRSERGVARLNVVLNMEHIERSYLIVALYYVFNSMPAVWAVFKKHFQAGGLPVRGTTHLALEWK